MEYGQRKPHSTKKGPGRRHKDGQPHGAAPIPAKGEFAGQHTNPAKRERRALIALMGRRQLLKALKRERRVQAAAAAMPEAA